MIHVNRLARLTTYHLCRDTFDRHKVQNKHLLTLPPLNLLRRKIFHINPDLAVITKDGFSLTVFTDSLCALPSVLPWCLIWIAAVYSTSFGKKLYIARSK